MAVKDDHDQGDIDDDFVPDPRVGFAVRATLSLCQWYANRFRYLLDQAAARGQPRRVAMRKLEVEMRIMPESERRKVREGLALVRLSRDKSSRQ